MYDTSQSPRKGRLRTSIRCALFILLVTTLLVSMNPSAVFAQNAPATSPTEEQASIDEAGAQLAAAQKELAASYNEYAAALEERESAQAAMVEAEDHIRTAEALKEEAQERLGERAVVMYQDGSLSFLDVLLGASSFEEFVTRLDYINAISAENAELVQANKEAQAEAEAAYNELALQEQIAAEREAEAAAAQERSEALVAEQQAILDNLEAEAAEKAQQVQEAQMAAAAEEVIHETPQVVSSTTQEVPAGGYSDVVAAAESRLGCGYVWGATGPDVFDCSGLTSWCYAQAGRGDIGRTDGAQAANAPASWPYSEGGAQPGDILRWTGHVAIYVGGGSYIHAANPSLGVCYGSSNLESATVLRF